MIYHGSYQTETIVIHPMDGIKETHFIELIKESDEPKFYVHCNSYGEDHVWEFWMHGISDYERVKFNIMNAIFECNTMEELMEMLDNIFNDGFADILIDGEECTSDCEHCECD